MSSLFKTTILAAGLLLTGNTFAQKATPSANKTSTDPVLLTISGSKVTKSQFESVYRKNSTKDVSTDKKSVESYLDLYINFKLKVREAEELGLDTAQSFKDELAGYRKQLAQPYLTDKDVNDKLLKEAYERLQTDVRASHILVKIDETALPKDSAEAYARITLIRNAVMGKNVASEETQYETLVKRNLSNIKKATHADSIAAKTKISSIQNFIKQLSMVSDPSQKFGNGAALISEDPSAKDNSGDLGYFTAMQMIYPFENMAYMTKVGDVSMPVRTRYGYHIIKVMDKRKAQGEIQVAHIMVKTGSASKEDSLNSRKKIDEIYEKVKKGENFADLAQQFSDDKPSSRKGGELPWFGTNKMPVEFELASFALKNNGDVSEPVKTRFGWHLIKRLDKKEPPAFDAIKGELKSKVSRDSRSLAGRSSLIAKVKTEYKFKENLKMRDEFYAKVDTSYFNGRWNADKAKGLNKEMFNLLDKKYTQTDFAKFLESHQSRTQKMDTKTLVNNMYNQFVDESAIAFKESRLDMEQPDFRALMQEYRDGILLFELTDKKVWSKAVKDSAGLANYYEKHKNNFLWDERAEATIYSCKDDKVAAKVREMVKKNKSDKEILAAINKDSQLNLQVENKVFQKKENELVDANWNPGISPNKEINKKIEFVNVIKLLKPTPKSFADAKGLVTAEYQTQLEKDWIETLKAKYKVEVDKSVLSTIQ